MTGQPSESPSRGSQYIYESLVDAGVDILVGLPGTQTLPLDRTVAQNSDVDYLMARHETAIPHVAWGYYESGGGMAATLTVPGPGDTNAMHGLKNALEDCVPLIHISADTNPDDRGKKPIHEIEPDTFDNVVKENINVSKPIELTEKIERAIQIAKHPPFGPVRIGVPKAILTAGVDSAAVSVEPERVEFDNDGLCREAASMIAEADRPVVYIGGGTRRSPSGPAAAETLVDAIDAPVVCSHKGKGVFPDDDPRQIGTTAAHLPRGARDVLEGADLICALGTDFDGITTDHWTLPLDTSLVHVNLSAAAIDEAYEAELAIRGDVGEVVGSIMTHLSTDESQRQGWDGHDIGRAVTDEYLEHLESQGMLSDSTPAHTPAVLRMIRDVLPRDSIVTTGVGGHRLWMLQVFQAYGHTEFITAGSWAGMGVGLPAAIGAKLANPERDVVTLSGDGGLMMCIHELHTAAERDLDITTVVFNNSDYGIISKSPDIKKYSDGHRFTWNSPDFVTIAEGFGCRGTRARSAREAREAVADSLDRSDGPELIDVTIDPHEQSVVEASEYDSDISFE